MWFKLVNIFVLVIVFVFTTMFLLPRIAVKFSVGFIFLFVLLYIFVFVFTIMLLSPRIAVGFAMGFARALFEYLHCEYTKTSRWWWCRIRFSLKIKDIFWHFNWCLWQYCCCSGANLKSQSRLSSLDPWAFSFRTKRRENQILCATCVWAWGSFAKLHLKLHCFAFAQPPLLLPH